MGSDDLLGTIEAAPVVADLYSLALASCRPGGLYLEFGVYHGRSLREIRNRLPLDVRLYGFDSFEGLPEEWCGMPAGTFRTLLRPDRLRNAELVVGRFEETLPRFLESHHGFVSFAHVDCDLYSSTRTVLANLKDRIVPGTVILFDELHGFDGYERHEFRALSEFAEAEKLKLSVPARWTTHRAAVKVIK